jgi:excisionase family DNA binding protein
MSDVENQPTSSSASTQLFIGVEEVALCLGVSTSWVRRHTSELPVVRMGRLVRFDRELLAKAIMGRMSDGKSLRPERSVMPSRFQRGYVFQKVKKLKVWYGVYREDIRTPDGLKRVQRKVRLGTQADVPTKSAARSKLSDLIGDSSAPSGTVMNFRELTQRWEKAQGPTIKSSSLLHYRNALRTYVLPVSADLNISVINREKIQTLLAEKAVLLRRSGVHPRLVSGIPWSQESNISQWFPNDFRGHK